ncbi:MAG: hypothetical protein KAJ10_05390 [Thermodesulfovibrionia bacterium]|nr:hypothetical protein [Thermodesulfovibrionia bacterium]
MSYITPTKKARVEARISAKEAQLAKLDTAYEAASTEIEEYRFDSGDGSQRSKYRSLEKIGKEIERLEREIERLYQTLNGTGIVNLNLRRNPSNYGQVY